MSGTVAFRQALSQIISNAESSEPSVDVKARQLHDVVLGQSSSKNEMPTCCHVMWQEFSDENGDLILATPPSGKGSSLMIRYALPRKNNVKRGMPTGLLKIEAPIRLVDSIFSNFRTLLTDRERIADAALLFQKTKGESLRRTIGDLQIGLIQKKKNEISPIVNGVDVDAAFRAALLVKAASAQVSEVVHALAILLSIPKILEDGEVIESLSLGAGNTGGHHDLETDRRVAEFKIIDWKGADSVREAQLFKDFFILAESATTKRRFLYITGHNWADKALRGGRDCKSVLKKKLLSVLAEKYPDVQTFGDYFARKQADVHVVGLDALLFQFTRDLGLQSAP